MEQGIWLGFKQIDELIKFLVPPKIFAKHLGIFGSTGSGKTVLGKIFIEEMALQQIPSIIIDPQGDISSIIFKNEDAILEEKRIPLKKVEKFYDSTNIRVFTPASNKGMSISINPVIFPSFNTEEIETVRILDNVANTLLELLNKLVNFPNSKTMQAKSVIFTILLENWKNNKKVSDIEELAQYLQKDTTLYKKFMNEREKRKLIISLNNLLVGSTGLLFNGKFNLDVGTLLEKDGERVPINIFFLKSLLNENEKFLFISILVQSLYSWMIQQGSSRELKCYFYLDEVAPFLPAGMSMPPGKEILLLLLRQARKYGISCAIASQSPKDIDYHGLDQLNSLFIGRLISPQSKNIIESMLESKVDPNQLEDVMNAIQILETGNFISFLPDLEDERFPLQFKTRYLFSKHITLTETDLRNFYMDESRENISNIPKDINTEKFQIVKKGIESRIFGENIYVFDDLEDDLVEDIMERVLEYNYYESFNFTFLSKQIFKIKKYNNALFDYVEKFMKNFEYEKVEKTVLDIGLPVIVFRNYESIIIISCLIMNDKVKFGVFGSSEIKKYMNNVDKIIEGIRKLIMKVKI